MGNHISHLTFISNKSKLSYKFNGRINYPYPTFDQGISYKCSAFCVASARNRFEIYPNYISPFFLYNAEKQLYIDEQGDIQILSTPYDCLGSGKLSLTSIANSFKNVSLKDYLCNKTSCHLPAIDNNFIQKYRINNNDDNVVILTHSLLCDNNISNFNSLIDICNFVLCNNPESTITIGFKCNFTNFYNNGKQYSAIKKHYYFDYSDSNERNENSHSVCVSEIGDDYIECFNSCGSDWGANGYFRFKSTDDYTFKNVFEVFEILRPTNRLYVFTPNTYNIGVESIFNIDNTYLFILTKGQYCILSDGLSLCLNNIYQSDNILIACFQLNKNEFCVNRFVISQNEIIHFYLIRDNRYYKSTVSFEGNDKSDIIVSFTVNKVTEKIDLPKTILNTSNNLVDGNEIAPYDTHKFKLKKG